VDIVTKTYGYVFHKVDIISILSKLALAHLLNANIERALRSVLGMGDT
jgi:hypothetical protein